MTFKASAKLKPHLADPARPFIHRDLSWLQFNARVLAQADEPSNPLLERVKFLAISSSNLDEFFMIRLSALGRAIAAEVRKNSAAPLRRLRRIRSVILGTVHKVIEHQAKTLEALTDELARHGIFLVLDPRTTGVSNTLGKKLFEEKILPELEPPAPFSPSQLTLLDNLQMAMIFSSGVWVRIPKRLRSVLWTRDESTGQIYIFFLGRLLTAYLGDALRIPGEPLAVRLTRDADVSVELDEEDTESIPDVMLSGLRKRDRGRPIRLQYLGKPDRSFLRDAHQVLKLNPQQIFEAPTALGLHRLWSVINDLPEEVRSRPGMTYAPHKPMIPLIISSNPAGIFEYLNGRDLLLHHPYDSFEAYVHWIKAACDDPKTTMVQQTVYRMDALSPVIEALKCAAAAGKKVRVVIELRARFDELNNLRLTDELRKAGIEVAFGFGKLKLHAKVALITRVENGEQRLYTHLSTGNYNSVTARGYTDLAVLTGNQEIGQDAAHFFESVWKGQVPTAFKRLVPAPTKLHRRILQLIDAEIAAAKAGKPARIITKVNTLVDEAVIEKLYGASQAGVKVDLIVRGACSIVPGIKGLSENIRVISIVDRYLEHSRIYYFESSKTMYFSSADWMPRNFFSRLELAFPVLDDSIYRFLESIVLPTYLSDRARAHRLNSDGQWQKIEPRPGEAAVRSQFAFEDIARNLYRGTPLDSP